MTALNRSYTFDKNLQLKDAGLVAASAAAQVGGVATVRDLGTGRVDARAIIDISAIEIATGDEAYRLRVQGSNDITFATGVVTLAERQVGNAAVTGNSAADTVGRYEVPFTNDVNGVRYRYVRQFTTVVGTIATGINYTSFIAKE